VVVGVGGREEQIDSNIIVRHHHLTQTIKKKQIPKLDVVCLFLTISYTSHPQVKDLIKKLIVDKSDKVR
jgi:hypothetical protein